MAGASAIAECRALLSATPRLPGVDGRKASKSLGNAIPLSASTDAIRALVRAMYTDPGHLRASDPGRVEGNVVFAYLDALDPDTTAVSELKAHYRRGGLGDAVLKRRLEDVLEQVIAPMRARRTAFASDRAYVRDMLREGTARAEGVTRSVLRTVREAFALGGGAAGAHSCPVRHSLTRRCLQPAQEFHLYPTDNASGPKHFSSVSMTLTFSEIPRCVLGPF